MTKDKTVLLTIHIWNMLFGVDLLYHHHWYGLFNLVVGIAGLMLDSYLAGRRY